MRTRKGCENNVRIGGLASNLEIGLPSPRKVRSPVSGNLLEVWRGQTGLNANFQDKLSLTLLLYDEDQCITLARS